MLIESIVRKTLGLKRHCVKKVVPKSWFQPLTILQGDILNIDYKSLIGDSQRVLLFWDVHGYDVAECVLGGIMPLLVDKQHIVIMHDISDVRYMSREQGDYRGNRLWRGNNWEGPRLFLGTLNTCVEQAVAILDFTTRNRLPLHSADHSFHTELGENPEKISELNQCLGKPFFDDSLQGHWVWFSMNEGEKPFYFPRFVPPGEGYGHAIASADSGDPEWTPSWGFSKENKYSFFTRIHIASKFLFGITPKVR